MTPTQIASLRKKILRKLLEKFNNTAREEIEDAVSSAFLSYFLLYEKQGKTVLNLDGLLYTIARHKLVKNNNKPISVEINEFIIDEITENDTMSIDSKYTIKGENYHTNVEEVLPELWQYGEDKVHIDKHGTLYIQMENSLKIQLYSLIIKHLKRKCLAIFLRMLLGWSDETIAEVFESASVGSLRNERGICMKDLRAAMKESGDWNRLFDLFF